MISGFFGVCMYRELARGFASVPVFSCVDSRPDLQAMDGPYSREY